MKLNEPTKNELDRMPKHLKSKEGIFIEEKTYIDYLKESEYKESYKNFCIDYYNYYRKEHQPFSDERMGIRHKNND